MKAVNRGTLFALFSGFLFSAPAVADFEQQVWEPVYGGGLSAEELMVRVAEDALAQDPDAVVSFEISVEAVVDGVQTIGDVKGLPGLEDQSVDGVLAQGSEISSATISIPIIVSQYQVDGILDSQLMSSSLAEMLANLRERESEKRKGEDFSIQHFGNQSNCGGYPLGTRVTTTSVSCIFGTTVSRYQCLPNADGGKDWFLTGQDHFPPDVACLDP